MSNIAEKLDIIADNQQKVYDAGYAAGLGAIPQSTAIYENGQFTTSSGIATFNKEVALFPSGVELIGASGWEVIGLDFNSDNISISWNAGKSGSVVSDAMIDFTNYKSIRIESVNVQGNTHLVKGVLYKLGTDGDLLNRVDEDAIVFELNEDFDLNEASGEYYIGIFCSTDKFTQVKITKIEIEGGDASSTQDGLWDIIQDYGKRTDYQYGFRAWGAEYIRPKYKVIPSNADYIFFNCPKLKKIENKYFDLSQSFYYSGGVPSATNHTFAQNERLEEIEDIGLQAGYYNSTFRYCDNLKKIAILRTTKECGYSLAFYRCKSLEEISVIEGEIGQNGFDVSGSPLLNHDTLMRIINALYDYSSEGVTKTIKFGATNLAKLTDAEIAIATQKGWTIA